MNDVRILAHLLRRRLGDTSPRGFLRTFPATILLVSMIVLCGLATWGLSTRQYRPVLDRFGLDYDLISDEHIWDLLTPLFIQPHPGIGWRMVLLVIVACASCELLAGSVPLLVTFFVTDWCATLLTSLALTGLSALGVERATVAMHIVDAGTSAAALGALAAAATLLRPSRLTVLTYGLLLGIVLVVAAMTIDEFGPAVVHVMAVLVGGGLGWLLWGPRLYPARSQAGRTVTHTVAGIAE